MKIIDKFIERYQNKNTAKNLGDNSNIEKKDKKLDTNNVEIIQKKEIEHDHETTESEGFIIFGKKIKFLSFNLTAERKEHIAKKIIEDSDVGKIYRGQLIISCMLATLGLLANSIPVIIGSMLVSPILTPIQSFAFAVICGKKHLYIKSLKILLLSILVAIPSSFLVCYFVPFATITEQVLLRGTPTVVDLVVALLSGIIAFLFLGYEKLEESIVGIAIAVSLMPPLAAVGIGLHFMNYSVAQGSFLLFVTNLVGILVMGIFVFYMFGFKPTNNKGKRRTGVTMVMVLIFVGLITVPLWKSMSKIAEDQKMTNEITKVTNSYLTTLNDGIVVGELSFHNITNDVVRISEKLDVPSDFTFTNVHKDELTKKLSSTIGKSVELDLDIVELSSVYIDNSSIEEKNLIQDVSNYLNKKKLLLVDYKVLHEDFTYYFFNIYENINTNKNDIYTEINSKILDKYGTGIKLVLQRQTNPELSRVEKTEAEIDLEKHFSLLFSGCTLKYLSVDYNEKMGDDDSYTEYVDISLEFSSIYSIYKTKEILEQWKDVLKLYFKMDVNLKAKYDVFSVYES